MFKISIGIFIAVLIEICISKIYTCQCGKLYENYEQPRSPDDKPD